MNNHTPPQRTALTTSSPDAKIEFLHRLRDSKWVSSYSLQLLMHSMRSAGVGTLLVTSTYRDPKDQARVMFDNLAKRTKPTMYKEHGQQVEAVFHGFERMAKEGISKGFDPAKPLPTPNRAMERMTSRITELQATFGVACVSKHQQDPSLVNVLDVAPSSIDPPSTLHAFIGLLTDSMLITRIGLPSSVARFNPKHFRESAECLHIEIAQPRAPLTRDYSSLV